MGATEQHTIFMKQRQHNIEAVIILVVVFLITAYLENI
jgi:hypothetical protein